MRDLEAMANRRKLSLSSQGLNRHRIEAGTMLPVEEQLLPTEMIASVTTP